MKNHIDSFRLLTILSLLLSSVQTFGQLSSSYCVSPVSVTNITATTMTFNYANVGGCTNCTYEVGYSPMGSNFPFIPFLTTTTALSYTFTSLSPGTAYNVFVRASCDNVVSGIGNTDFTGLFAITAEPCNTTFLDTGGSSGNYGNNETTIQTFCPPTGSTDLVRMDFSTYDIGPGDQLELYSSPDAAGAIPANRMFNIINAFTLPPAPFSVLGAPSTTNPGGCITAVFNSDGQGTATGWEAAVSCMPQPPCEILNFSCSPDGSNAIDIFWDVNDLMVDIYVAVSQNNTQVFSQLIPSTVLSGNTFKITGLTPTTNFSIQYAANCQNNIMTELSYLSTGLVQTYPASQCFTLVIPPCGGNSSSIDWPADATVELSGLDALPDPSVSCTDCTDVEFTYTDVFTDFGCEDIILRTWTTIGACGGEQTHDQIITIIDDTPPSFIGEPTVDTTIVGPLDYNLPPPPFDDENGTVAVSYSDMLMQEDFGPFLWRTWTLTDECGNSCSFHTHYHFVDSPDVLPMICPKDSVIEIGEIPIYLDPQVIYPGDMDDITLNCSVQIESDTLRRICSATTTNGLIGSCETAYFYADNTPPNIMCPPDVNGACGDTGPWGQPTATDNSGGPITFSSIMTTDNSVPCLTLHTIIWTATDASNNSSTCTQQIFLYDQAPPVITPVMDVMINCDDNLPPIANPTVIDDCNAATIQYLGETVIDPDPCNTLLRRTWEADDGCGNIAIETQDILIVDNVPPEFTHCPPDQLIGVGDPWSHGTPVVTDKCQGSASLSFIDLTNAGGSCNVFERTWTADDGCGNTSTCTQAIYECPTPPTLSISCQDQTVNCDDTYTPIYPSVNSGFGPFSYSAGLPNPASDPTWPCGNRLIFWTVTDQATGQSQQCIQTLTVVDNTPPVATYCPPDQQIACTDPANINWGIPVFTDNCGSITVQSSDNVVIVDPCTTQYIRTWIALDECSNVSAPCVQVITMIDQQAPTLNCPMISTVNLGDPINFVGPSIKDDCADAAQMTITHTDQVIPVFCGYVHSRTWTVQDPCGNTSTCVENIEELDLTAPIIVCPPDQILDCNDPVNYGVATATDNWSAVNDISIFYTDQTTVIDPCTTLITVTWTAVDECGNNASCIQTITITDMVPPVIDCPAINEGLLCSQFNTIPLATATDNCDQNVDLNYVDTYSGDPCTPLILRTWTATDDCNNTSSCTQQFQLADDTDPVFTCPPDQFFNLPTGVNGTTATYNVTVADNCIYPVTVNYSIPPGSFFTCGVHPVTVTVDDGCSALSCLFYINVSCAGPFACPGDLNGTGVVDINDFLQLNSAFGTTCTGCPEDITEDGVVDINDFLELNSNYGNDCTTPIQDEGQASFRVHQELMDFIAENESQINKELASEIRVLTQSFTIIPNPNNGDRFQLRVDGLFEEGCQFQLSIHDATGRLVHQSFETCRELVEVRTEQQLERGVYLLSVVAEDKVLSQRMVVE